LTFATCEYPAPPGGISVLGFRNSFDGLDMIFSV
jgi:hypothetical protein